MGKLEIGKKNEGVAEGFNVQEKTVEILLHAKQSGKTYDLLHVLNEPTPKQWKEYQAAANKFKTDSRTVQIQNTTLGAQEKLWNEIAVRVEGYNDGEKPLECAGENWRRLVSILHKSQAIRALGEVWFGDEDEEKNSGTASDD